MSSSKNKQNEHSAHERRCWVRLTEVCNNRCMFCHDSGAHTGRMADFESLVAEIDEGRQQDCQRLILSGGEPTVHPRFLELIAQGKRAGYGWVQTVSNGRMFAYADFARKAQRAGLDEVTLSMHGHTAELHDMLVGVSGGFEQSLRGLDNLQALPHMVVSVDVVLNALNLPLLPELLGFYLDRGVREFDLLWLVPFGRAWENRASLFVAQPGRLDSLRRAYRLCQQRDAVVWTNRLPAELLEGCEELIQNPDKLHDEVRGRLDDLEQAFAQGESLPCWDEERCCQCFMDGFCVSLSELGRQSRRGWLDRVLVQADHSPKMLAPAVLKAPQLLVQAHSLSAAARFVRSLPAGRRQVTALISEGPARPDPGDWGEGNELVRIASPAADCLQPWLDDSGYELEIVLSDELGDWIGENGAALEERDGSILLSALPGAALKRKPTETLAILSGAGVRLSNLPPCLVPGEPLFESKPLRCAEAISPSGELDLQRFTDFFIDHDYRVFSHRCQLCQVGKNCPGLPIQLARRHGLGMVQPIAP